MAFVVRDLMTIGAAFNIAPWLGEKSGNPAMATVFVPLAVQLLSAPIHLWALDNYNRPNQVGGAPQSFRATSPHASTPPLAAPPRTRPPTNTKHAPTHRPGIPPPRISMYRPLTLA